MSGPHVTTRIEVDQFSAFGRLDLDLSPGLNVFIGENSTGKSHLMKLIYSLLKPFEAAKFDSPPKNLKHKLEEKLARVFMPSDSDLGRLVRRGVGRRSARVTLHHGPQKIRFTLSTLGNLRPMEMSLAATPPCIFLPAHDALAMYEGFISAYENRELSFDETYFDLCKALSGLPLRGARGKEARKLLPPLENILGGRVRLKGGRFSLESKRSEGTIEVQLMAEGHRKLATVAHLIANGSLMQNSVIFWDEPEANLNPKLITEVAKLLRDLVALGVQVFISTHDFLLSQELDLAVEYATDPVVDTKFHAFSRKKPSGPVTVQSSSSLSDLEDNAILQEFAEHYDREQRLFTSSAALSGTRE